MTGPERRPESGAGVLPGEKGTTEAAPEPGCDDARAAAERRRRRAKVFGEVLPEGTSDDRAEAWGDRAGERSGGSDDWLRAQVPPHHG